MVREGGPSRTGHTTAEHITAEHILGEHRRGLSAMVPWETCARPVPPSAHLSAWLPTPTRAAAKRTMRCVLRSARHWRQANWGEGGTGWRHAGQWVRDGAE